MVRPDHMAWTILLGAALVTALGGLLELANPGNYWLLFEDVSAAVAPGAGALAVAMAVSRSAPEHRGFMRVLALALGVTAFGQLVADVPDAFPAAAGPWLRAVSEGCNVVGAIVSIAALWRTLYGRLEGEARRQALLDGLIIMAASTTFICANWLIGTVVPGAPGGDLLAASTINLLVPLASAIFVSTAAAAAVCALALRVEPCHLSIGSSPPAAEFGPSRPESCSSTWPGTAGSVGSSPARRTASNRWTSSFPRVR